MPLFAFLGRSKPKKNSEYSAVVDRRLFRDLGQEFPLLGSTNGRAPFEESVKYFEKELYRVDCSIAWISDNLTPCSIKVRQARGTKRLSQLKQ